MRRRHSTFPGGLPGVGLLLLRIAVGGRFLLGAFAWIAESQRMDALMWTIVLVVLVVGLALLAGLLTRLCSTLSALAAGVIIVWHPVWDLPMTSLLSFDLLVMATAIVMLGPGAFSFDARVFGLRKIMIPRATASQGSSSL